jgi:hypothetical protein
MSQPHACDFIVADYSKEVFVEENSAMEIPLPNFEVQDTYPETPYLSSLAAAGCEFCKLLRQITVEKIRMSGISFHSLPTTFFITEASLVSGGDDQSSLYALRAHLVLEETNFVDCLEFSLHADQGTVYPTRLHVYVLSGLFC